MKHLVLSLLQRPGHLLFTLVLATAGLRAATTTPPPAKEPVKAISYRISPTDKVSINVIGEPDLNVTNKRVDANGNVNLALLPDVVHLAGLTVAEAQSLVENAYKEARILRNPQVAINIEDYAPREVSISGMVKSPAKYALPPETVMTLVNLVLKAGGFSDTANGTKVRVSRTNPDGTTTVFIKDIDSVVRGKNTGNSTDASFVLEPGDIVYVPEKLI
jgi:polysaccharide export outer membrane protein